MRTNDSYLVYTVKSNRKLFNPMIVIQSFVINLLIMRAILVLPLLFLCIFEADALNSTTGTNSLTSVNDTKTYDSVAPTWLTSPYFRAGNQAVIKTLTGNNQTPTYTFTFSSPLTGLPSLAYGIKNYRGKDHVIQETTISAKSSTRSKR